MHWAKEVVKVVRTMERKPQTLHQHGTKCLEDMTGNGWSPLRAVGVKVLYHLKDFALRRELWDKLFTLREVFPLRAAIWAFMGHWAVGVIQME